MSFLLQAIVLTISFGFVYIWQNSALAPYTIAIISLLVLSHILLTFTKRFPNLLASSNDSIRVFILNSVVFLLIFATGSLNSILFFLLYFLGFGISFVFHPAVVFVFVAGTFAVFYQDAIVGDTIGNFLKLGSVALISPIAYFFGREFRNRETEEEKVKYSAGIIEEQAKTLLSKKGSTKNHKDELKRILEESEKLKDL